MSRQPKTPRRGKHLKRPRDFHSKSTSPEVVRWLAEEGIPDCPSWMDAATYSALARLRLEL